VSLTTTPNFLLSLSLSLYRYLGEQTHCLRVLLGYPLRGGNKYRNLVFQFGGSLICEKVKYSNESRGILIQFPTRRVL
jgi:hypothetical protein